MNNSYQPPEAETKPPYRLPTKPPSPFGKLMVFSPPLIYLAFFLTSVVGVQDFYSPGGGDLIGLWLMSFFVCHFVLPGVALVQLFVGIVKVRAKDDSGNRHIVSSLLVGVLWFAYFAFLSGGGFPTV